jgi:hypothetical protein
MQPWRAQSLALMVHGSHLYTRNWLISMPAAQKIARILEILLDFCRSIPQEDESLDFRWKQSD